MPPDMRTLMEIVLTEGSAPRLISERRVTLDDEREMVVWENPSAPELRKLIDQFGTLRGLMDLDGPMTVWDANTWVHHTIGKYIGHQHIYLYFSKKGANHEEWEDHMRKRGNIYVGVKAYEKKSATAYRIALTNPNFARAIGVPALPKLDASSPDLAYK